MKDSEETGNIEIPNLKCELNTLVKADGSCILCHDDNVMAAAIYGPVEVKLHKMLIDKASVDVMFKPQSGQSPFPKGELKYAIFSALEITDRLYESLIGKICTTAIITTFYPRTSIYIIIQEMQNTGDALACSINATCLALIHSGVAMNYLFAAVTTRVRSTSTDTNQQDNVAEPRVTFVFENTSNKVLAVDTRGKITDAEYDESMVNCRQASTAIFQFYKDMISKYALKM